MPRKPPPSGESFKFGAATQPLQMTPLCKIKGHRRRPRRADPPRRVHATVAIIVQLHPERVAVLMLRLRLP
eukprot:9690026-Alexandrium_andersonii.AAC.1